MTLCRERREYSVAGKNGALHRRPSNRMPAVLAGTLLAVASRRRERLLPFCSAVSDAPDNLHNPVFNHSD